MLIILIGMVYNNTMQIRDAQPSDKQAVLDFCKDTFSWGDYIADIWDSWILQGNLFVAVENDIPIGLSHLVFMDNRQAWLEGIRVNPNHRRKGYGRRIISHCESIANSKTIRMIIESDNTPSIDLARSMGYSIEDWWRLYALTPKKETSSVVLASDINQVTRFVSSYTYVDSWKWLPLENLDLEELIRQKRILLSMQNGRVLAMGIWNESKNFANVLQLGFINGTDEGMLDVLRFIQNKGYELHSERIQVFSQAKNILEMESLTKRPLFYLMKKDLKKNL
jgi:GNAT superfamily N-acetyltransferase